MSTTYTDITITSKDEVTVTLTRYATDADHGEIVSETATSLPGIWGAAGDEHILAAITEAGIAPALNEQAEPGVRRVTGGVESYELHGPVSVDADAIYTNADGSIELVTLDATDCVDQVLATLTEDEMLAIHAGETKYRTIGHDVEVGDGDTFQRLALR